MMEMKTVHFKGMPLFQKTALEAPFSMQGEIQDMACFFYMKNGYIESYDARGRHLTSPKNAILKNCGRYVQQFYGLPNKPVCEAIVVYLYPQLLLEIYKDEVPAFLSKKTASAPKRFIGNKLIEQYMENLSIYFEDPQSLDEELGVLKIKELILILLKSENHENISAFLSDIFAPVNVALKEVVENNLYNNLSIEQLAYLCNMSLSTFKRAFKKSYGNTPARYIKSRRLAEAKKRLLSSADSITEIAFSLGFSDVSTFSAVFQQFYQLSPSKFRKSQMSKKVN